MHFSLLPSHGNPDYQQMPLPSPTYLWIPTDVLQKLFLSASISGSLAAASWPTMESMEEEEEEEGVEAPHPSHLPSDLWPSWPRGVDKCWMHFR